MLRNAQLSIASSTSANLARKLCRVTSIFLPLKSGIQTTIKKNYVHNFCEWSFCWQKTWASTVKILLSFLLLFSNFMAVSAARSAEKIRFKQITFVQSGSYRYMKSGMQTYFFLASYAFRSKVLDPIRDPISGKQIHPGSRGKKSTGSRIRNTGKDQI
jgi:hypothetical protein